MKVKNVGTNTIWIREVKILPGVTEEVNDDYIKYMKGLKAVVVGTPGTSHISGKIKVVKTDSDLQKLIDLKGVEDELAKELIDRFKTVEGVKNASLDELEAIPGIGSKRAKLIKKQLEEEVEEGPTPRNEA